MYAVVEIGGKLYRIENGSELLVDKINAGEGEKLKFDKVTLYRTDKDIMIGRPYIGGIHVEGKVIEGLKKGGKVVVFKYKQKANYRRKRGHRQQYTKIKITGIKISEKKHKSDTKTDEVQA